MIKLQIRKRDSHVVSQVLLFIRIWVHIYLLSLITNKIILGSRGIMIFSPFMFKWDLRFFDIPSLYRVLQIFWYLNYAHLNLNSYSLFFFLDFTGNLNLVKYQKRN